MLMLFQNLLHALFFVCCVAFIVCLLLFTGKTKTNGKDDEIR